jgi:hypothetical protein
MHKLCAMAERCQQGSAVTAAAANCGCIRNYTATQLICAMAVNPLENMRLERYFQNGTASPCYCMLVRMCHEIHI